MFPVRLTHPFHGATHAHDSSELEYLTKQGWQTAPIVHVEQSQTLVVAPKKRAYNRKAA